MDGFGRGLKSTTIVLSAVLAAVSLGGCVRPSAAQQRHDQTVRTRTLTWSGGDHLYVAMAADVRYVPGAAGTVVVTGPTDAIEDIVVDGGVIRHDQQHWGWGPWNWRWNWGWSSPVKIVVTAPQINEAGVGGSGHLDMGRLSQDHLVLSVSGSGALQASGQFKTLAVSISGSGSQRLDQVNAGDMTANLSGSGWMRATGAANSLHLGVSGSGGADLGGLTAQDVDAHLTGSGSASLSPKQSADVSVFGSGAVRLLTEPPKLNTHRGGSGAIILPSGSRA